jgi:hypothetical protein
MPLNRSLIHRGVRQTGGAYPATYVRHAPISPDLAETFRETLAAAGPVPSAEKSAQLAAERREPEERLAAIRQRIADFNAAHL